MQIEPFAEQLLQFVRQAQHGVASDARSLRGRLFENLFQIHVGNRRNDWRDEHTARNPRRVQIADHLQASMRCCRAGFERTCKAVVQRIDRNEHLDQVLRCHWREKIKISFDQGVLGDDRQRMIAGLQHLDDLACDPVLALDRLIAVGIRAERDRLADIARFGQFGA